MIRNLEAAVEILKSRLDTLNGNSSLAFNHDLSQELEIKSEVTSVDKLDKQFGPFFTKEEFDESLR